LPTRTKLLGLAQAGIFLPIYFIPSPLGQFFWIDAQKLADL